MNAKDIIKHYSMQPLPDEGGFYVETYRSEESIVGQALAGRYGGRPRNIATSILYLITPESFSKMHRVRSDEIFHFYLGDAVEMLQLYLDGGSETVIMGTDIKAGDLQQLTVKRGIWQGIKLKDGGKFALLGCTVSPGFEFEDYQPGVLEELVKTYPDQKELIEKYF